MKKHYLGENLFGEDIMRDPLLSEKYKVSPFSVLDTKSGAWQTRAKLWKSLGMKGDAGRPQLLTYGENVADINKYRKKEGKTNKSTIKGSSFFDPVLTEVMYSWYCPEKGSILDMFCGGVMGGTIAGYLGYKYTGIDVRSEQIECNIKQASAILPNVDLVRYICGDSNEILGGGCFKSLWICFTLVLLTETWKNILN